MPCEGQKGRTKKVGRLLSPCATNSADEAGIGGNALKSPEKSEARSAVARSDVPFGQEYVVSADESMANTTSNSRALTRSLEWIDVSVAARTRVATGADKSRDLRS